jgi:RNA 3'-terminal phosphate cyclase (ATP)
MIEIDGSVGEGGGQILRTSLALALCTGVPVRFERIRAGRAKPGLMRQHLTCVQAAARVGGAHVEGAELGSQSLVFEPHGLHPGRHEFAIGTAGSCTLVLQTVWPALMLADAPSTLKLAGGTHNPMAPPFHFLERCYAPLLRRLGADAALRLHRLGFHPAGGGEIEVVVQPAGDRLAPVDILERGAHVESYAESLAPGLPRNVAFRELETIARLLGWNPPQLRTPVVRQNEGPGNALLLTLAHEHVTELVTAFGERGLSAEQVAKAAAREARAWLAADGALGPHLADQWTLPLAIAVWKRGGRAAFTCTELTPHATTNFETVAKFLPVRFETRAHGRGWHVAVERVD